MNLQFNVVVKGTAVSAFTKQMIEDRLFVLKELKQTVQIQEEIAFLVRLLAEYE